MLGLPSSVVVECGPEETDRSTHGWPEPPNDTKPEMPPDAPCATVATVSKKCVYFLTLSSRQGEYARVFGIYEFKEQALDTIPSVPHVTQYLMYEEVPFGTNPVAAYRAVYESKAGCWEIISETTTYITPTALVG